MTRIEGDQKVFVDIAHAGMDVSDTLTSMLTKLSHYSSINEQASVFTEPKSIDLNREMKKYLIGDGAVR